MKNPTIGVLLSTLFFAAGCSTSDSTPEKNYIAHGGGAIDGHTYTNSKEAVEHAIDCGLRYIELDLSMTSDSVLVAAHDWEMFRHMSNTPPPMQPTA